MKDHKLSLQSGSGKEQFKKIGNSMNYSHDLAIATIDRLELTVMELQNLQNNNTEQTKTMGKQLRSLNGNIKDLILTIKKANAKNDKLQEWFFTLAAIATMCALLSIIQVIDIIIRGIGK